MNKLVLALSLLILSSLAIATSSTPTQQSGEAARSASTTITYRLVPLGKDVVRAMASANAVAWAILVSGPEPFEWRIEVGGESYVIRSLTLNSVVVTSEGRVWAINYSSKPELLTNHTCLSREGLPPGIPASGDKRYVWVSLRWELVEISGVGVRVLDEGVIEGLMDLWSQRFFGCSPAPEIVYRGGSPYLIRMNSTYFEGVAYLGESKVTLRAKGRLPEGIAGAIPLGAKEYVLYGTAGAYLLTEEGISSLDKITQSISEAYAVKGGALVGPYIVFENGTTSYVGEPVAVSPDGGVIACESGDALTIYRLSDSGIISTYSLSVYADAVSLSEGLIHILKESTGGIEIYQYTLPPYLVEAGHATLERGHPIGDDRPRQVQIDGSGSYDGGAYALIKYEVGEDEKAYALLIINDTPVAQPTVSAAEAELRKVNEIPLPPDVTRAGLEAYLGKGTLAFYAWGKLYLVRDGNVAGVYDIPPPVWVIDGYLYLANNTHILVMDPGNGRVVGAYAIPGWLTPPRALIKFVNAMAWDGRACVPTDLLSSVIQPLSIVIKGMSISIHSGGYCSPEARLPSFWGEAIGGLIEGAYGDAAIVITGHRDYALLTGEGLMYLSGELLAGPGVVDGGLAALVKGPGNESAACLLIWDNGLKEACLDFEPVKAVLWEKGVVVVKEEGGSEKAIVYEVVA